MSTYLIAAGICLLLSAFFSAAEMAYSSLNRLRIDNAAEDGSRRARLAGKIADSIAIMYRGQIIEQSGADEIIRAPKEAYTKRLIEDVPKL